MRRKESERRAIDAEERLTVSQEELVIVQGALVRAHESIAKATILTLEQLQELASDYPQWGVAVGVEEGRLCKKFTRNLDDLSPQVSDAEAVTRFRDPVAFDETLPKIFESDNFGGTGPRFFIEAPEGEHAITLYDRHRIQAAEAYLRENNYIATTTTQRLTEI